MWWISGIEFSISRSGQLTNLGIRIFSIASGPFHQKMICARVNHIAFQKDMR